MKMRRKLAALLATVMLVSVMPMTAFARSSNNVTKTVHVKEDTELGSDAPMVEIDLKNNLTGNRVFNLELDNAEIPVGTTIAAIDADNNVLADLTVKATAKKIIQVKSGSNGQIPVKFFISLEGVKVTGGEATVKIDSMGTEVTSSGPYVFAVAGDKDAKATVKVANPKTYVQDEPMAASDITITEPYAGAINSSLGNGKITLELDDRDFIFDTTNLIVEGVKVFDDVTNYTLENASKLVITVPSAAVNKAQKGEFKIKGLKINSRRNASKGDVTASIRAPFIDEETITLAKLSDYSTNLTTDKVEEFTAGNEKTVKFTLEEARGTLVNRSASFIFSEGIEITEVKKVGEHSNPNNNKDVLVVDRNVKDKDQNELVIYNMANALDGDKIKFEVKVNIPLNFKGDLMVKTDSRAFDNSELKLADVKSRVDVKVDPIHVKAGTKTTKGGKITLTETKKGNIERGYITLDLDEDDLFDGLDFRNVKDLDIKTTGGIKVDEPTTSGAAIRMRVSRPATGDEPGTIEISGFEIRSRYTIVDGTYDIKIGGDALTDIKELQNKKKDTMTVENFLIVGDMARKVVFTIGETEFTVNGKVMNMDAAAYIKDGRTMVPLRYLSYALGIDEEDIKFNSGVVTIFAKDGKVIQVRNGDNNLTVNGMNIPMVAAAEIIEGRTYVPVTEIGGVFGVTGTWDPVAQTATFQ